MATTASDLLRLLMRTWWSRIGLTPAGGITKVIIAEVRNFPDIAQFWIDEVILPAHRLLAGTIQRGIDRGEFRSVPVHEAVHALVAPSLFLGLYKHSIGACPVRGLLLHEGDVIDTQIDLVLQGLERRCEAQTQQGAEVPCAAAAPARRRRGVRP